MRRKLKSQKKKEEKLLIENQRREEEIQEAERKYQDVQEEVDELRKINKRLRSKLKNAMGEIRDLTQEHETEKEDLLETIRDQERDGKMNLAIIQIMLSNEEIEKIKSQAIWNESLNEYKIPPFILKERKLKFPKLPMNQAMELIDNEKNSRDFEWIQKPKNTQEVNYENENGFEDDDDDEYNQEDLNNGQGNYQQKEKYNMPSQSILKANFYLRGNSIRNFGNDNKPTPKRNVNLQLDPLQNNKSNIPVPLAIHHSPNPPENKKGKHHGALKPLNQNPRSMEVSFKATLHFDRKDDRKQTNPKFT